MPIKVGSSGMTKLYVGSTEISKAYKGSTQVFPAPGGGGTTTLWTGESVTLGSLESSFGGTNTGSDPTKAQNAFLQMHIDPGDWTSVGGTPTYSSSSGFGSNLGWNVDMGVIIEVLTPGQTGPIFTADDVHASWSKSEDSSTSLSLSNGWWLSNNAYTLVNSATNSPSSVNATYPRLRAQGNGEMFVDIQFASASARDAFATEIGTSAVVRVQIRVTS